MRDIIDTEWEKSCEQLKQLMELEQEFFRLNTIYGADKVKRIMKTTKCSVFEVEQYVNSLIIDNNDGTYYMLSPFEIDKGGEQCIKMLPSDQITQLKSQLKHCRNPLQKLNIEREINRLYKETKK